MAKILSQLLNATEPAFTFGLSDLEKLSGHRSVDIRLVSEISATVQQKIKELGLNPLDTTGKEFYHALQGLIALHDSYLAQAIGVQSTGELSEQLVGIQKALRKLPIARSSWTMKHSVAKKLLKSHPPKKVMKQLNYKSIDSMLKRESIGEIYTATRFMETKSWQKKLISSYKKLTPSDFEIRDIEVLLLDKERWGSAADAYIYAQRHNITHLKELGVVMILPLPIRRMKGVVITVMPLAIHYMNEIRSYSAFFKMQQVRSDFGEIVSKTILDDPKTTAKIAGKAIHWRLIQRHFGGHSSSQPELFEPHVQIEDLYWRTAEDVLYTIEPALKFWEHLDFVAVLKDGIPVSCNLMDNAVSYCNSLEYGEQSVGHFRESLWNEIYLRYMGEHAIEDIVVSQLSQEVILPEMEL